MMVRPDSHARFPAPTRVQARDGQDFTIPAPQKPERQAEPPAPDRAMVAASAIAPRDRAPTAQEAAAGAAVLAVLAILLLLLRSGVRAHLIGRRAALDAADGASWMLFTALLCTAALLTGTTLWHLWHAWAGLTLGFSLCAILLAAALVLVVRAPERRR